MACLFSNRRVGESIYVGVDIKITVTNVSGNQVSIGIEVPENVSVLREKLFENIDYADIDVL